MKLHRLGSIATAVSCIGIVLPTSALATAPPALRSCRHVSGSAPPAAAVDERHCPSPGWSARWPGGRSTGRSKGRHAVSIQFAGKEVVTTTTDANGVFAAKGLRGGQYQLHHAARRQRLSLVGSRHGAPVGPAGRFGRFGK